MNDAEAALPNDIALCHELIRQQATALEQAQRRIEQLEHSLDLLLRQRYGPRSEHERAKQLLQGDGRTLGQVAARAGFSDQSQSSQHVKRLVGVTPGQFRTPPRST
jgi:hypothetical protein